MGIQQISLAHFKLKVQSAISQLLRVGLESILKKRAEQAGSTSL